jgi:hypothetical protein
VAAAAAIFAVPNLDAWRTMLASGVETPAVLAAPSTADRPLPVPRRGETALARARTLAGAGRLHDAIAVLESIRLTDPERPEADRFRADIQRQLLALSSPTR